MWPPGGVKDFQLQSRIVDVMRLGSYEYARRLALEYKEVTGYLPRQWEDILTRLVEEDEIKQYGF